jgi:hypothetical protein
MTKKPEIRPARGAVKLKNKECLPKEPEVQDKPIVVQGTESRPNEADSAPSEEAIRIVNELSKYKAEFTSSMRAFNSLLNISILPENKSQADLTNEQNVINKLIRDAMNVDSLSPGEGMLGLCILALRQGLMLRDAGNKLAYEVHKLKTGTNIDDTKEKMRKFAEQNGLKINFEED